MDYIIPKKQAAEICGVLFFTAFVVYAIVYNVGLYTGRHEPRPAPAPVYLNVEFVGSFAYECEDGSRWTDVSLVEVPAQ